MNVPQRRRAPAGPELLFCANCQVSVTAIELERGTAKRTPRGRIFCTLCTRAGPTERATRRQVLEQEFADDAPISGPAAVAPKAPESAPVAGAGKSDLDDRIAVLERTILRLQERLSRLEDRSRDAR
jgi:hypothetical protein